MGFRETLIAAARTAHENGDIGFFQYRRLLRNANNPQFLSRAEDYVKEEALADGKFGAIDWSNIDWDKLFSIIERIISLIMKLFVVPALLFALLLAIGGTAAAADATQVAIVMPPRLPALQIPTVQVLAEVAPFKARCLIFTTEYCKQCEAVKVELGKLAGQGFVTSEDVKAPGHFHLIYVEPNDPGPLVAKYQVTSYPTLVITDLDGNMLSQRTGFMNQHDLGNWLNAHKDGKPSPSYQSFTQVAGASCASGNRSSSGSSVGRRWGRR